MESFNRRAQRQKPLQQLATIDPKNGADLDTQEKVKQFLANTQQSLLTTSLPNQPQFPVSFIVKKYRNCLFRTFRLHSKICFLHKMPPFSKQVNGQQ